MGLLTKLIALRNATSAVIEELREDGGVEAEIEAEILLTRSAKNRRSDENEVMTMSPLNGAPAVPEGWVKRMGVSKKGQANRELLAKILREYEPMSRPGVWDLSRELDPRLKPRKAMANYQQMVNRLIKIGQLSLKDKKLVRGKG